MSNELGINIKANVDLGDINQQLENTAQKFSQMTGSIGQGGQLKIDTGKFVEQMNSCNAAMEALHKKIAEQKKLGIDTSDAETKLKAFTQIQSDASKVLFGHSSIGSSGKTAGEAAQQRLRDELEKTRQAFKRYYSEISEGEKAAAKQTGRRGPENPDSFASVWEFFKQNDPSNQGTGKTAAPPAGGQRPQGGATGAAGGQPMTAHAASLMGALGGLTGSALAGGSGSFASLGGLAGGGIGAGIGKLFGGPAGFVAGAFLQPMLSGIGGALDSGLKDAQDEAIGVSDLRAGLGGLTNDFASLSAMVKSAGQGLGVVSTETVELAKKFAKASGMGPDQANELGEELRNAIGMARAFGTNTSGMASFFAQMRTSGVSRTSDDNRQLGAIISESIVRGGNMARADEVLQAIGAFSSSMARQTLTAPNAEGFASVLAALTQGKGPGLDVQGAASLLNQMDAGYKGNNSEAAQNFKLGIYQNSFGRNFSALDVDLVNQQGVFGSARTGLKQARDFAARMGDTAASERLDRIMASPNADTMNGILALQELKRRTGNDSTMYRKSGVGLFGGNEAMFMAFDQAMNDPIKLGQLKAIGNMPARNQSLAAQIMFEQDPTKLKGFASDLIQGKDLKGKLAASDVSTLESQVASGDTEGLRKSLLTIAKNASMTDSGNDLRDKVADVKQAIIDFSSRLLPAVDKVRDAVLFAAGKDFASFEKSQFAQRMAPYQSIVDAAERGLQDATPKLGGFGSDAEVREYKRRQGVLDAARKQYREEAAKYSSGPSSMTQTEGQLPAYIGNGPADFPTSGAKARKARPGMKLTPEELAYLSDTDKMLGAQDGTSAAQIQYESGNDPEAVSKRGAWGLGQIMPKERAEMERRMGRRIVTRMDQLEAHRLMMQENLREFGNLNDAQRAYNGGWVKSRWRNDETSGYVSGIDATRAEMQRTGATPDAGIGYSAFGGFGKDDQIPKDASRSGNGNNRFAFEPLNINLTGSFSSAGMTPIQIAQTHVSKPVPSGTN